MTDLITKIRSAEGMSLLDAVRVRYMSEPGGKLQVAVVSEDVPGEGKPAGKGQAPWRVLTSLQYFSHVLSRYPQNDYKLNPYGMELREMIAYIVDEGIWPGSNLLEDAGVNDRLELVTPDRLAAAEQVNAVLFRSPVVEGIDLALEPPAEVNHGHLNLTVIGLLQATTDKLDDTAIELLDRALRHHRVYVGEGVNYASPAAARNLANRSFQAAGGRIV